MHGSSRLVASSNWQLFSSGQGGSFPPCGVRRVVSVVHLRGLDASPLICRPLSATCDLGHFPVCAYGVGSKPPLYPLSCLVVICLRHGVMASAVPEFPCYRCAAVSDELTPRLSFQVVQLDHSSGEFGICFARKSGSSCISSKVFLRRDSNLPFFAVVLCGVAGSSRHFAGRCI